MRGECLVKRAGQETRWREGKNVLMEVSPHEISGWSATNDQAARSASTLEAMYYVHPSICACQYSIGTGHPSNRPRARAD